MTGMSHTTKAFAAHELTHVVDHPEVQIFRMARPGTGCFRVQLTFTREGIAIQGDICFGPANNGICSCVGYSLDWFAGHKSPNYLCSKFLHRDWHPEVGARRMREALDDPYGWEMTEAHQEAVRELLELEPYELTPNLVYDCLYEHDVDCSFSDWFTCYDPADAEWLVAVQRRFAELYAFGRRSNLSLCCRADLQQVDGTEFDLPNGTVVNTCTDCGGRS